MALRCSQYPGMRKNLWERACSRRRRHIQHHHKLIHRFREQARSHMGLRVITASAHNTKKLWERACSRWRQHSQHHSKLILRFREQARSHRRNAFTLKPGRLSGRLAGAFDLRRPVKPRWPNAGIAQWAPRHGCRGSRAGPWMALRGGPTEQCLRSGTPSLSEVPSGGARAF